MVNLIKAASGLRGKSGMGIVTALVPVITWATGNDFQGSEIVAVVGAVQTIIGFVDKLIKKYVGKK